jgi:hypothetical protein
MNKNKCVFVIGPESSGSMLIAKICAHVLGILPYGEWNGVGWCERSDGHRVCHRSLPFGDPPQYPDIERWIADYSSGYDVYFVLTTRDLSISELSRFERWARPFAHSRHESLIAREIMVRVLSGPQARMLWSYETFMFLGDAYLKELYEFLRIESVFSPRLLDANAAKVSRPHLVSIVLKRLNKALKRTRQSLLRH